MARGITETESQRGTNENCVRRRADSVSLRKRRCRSKPRVGSVSERTLG